MATYRSLPVQSRLPTALYRAEQVQAMDKMAIEEYSIAGETLMERAGMAAFSQMRALWPDARRLLVLAGVGNNAGDGFVVARLARQAGLDVQVLQLGERDRLRGDARLNAQRFSALSDAWRPFTGWLDDRVDLVVDALLGTGLERPLQGAWAEAVKAVNALRCPVFAVDIPSGLNADTGAVMGVAVQATASISFIALKQGMFTGQGPACCGQLGFDALQIPAQIYSRHLLSARRLDWAQLRRLLQPRLRTAHKGHFGHVLVVGGELGFGGAARLAAEAALRTGAGLVSLFTRPEHRSAVLAARPEIMVHASNDAHELLPLLQNCSVIAVGPGLGTTAWGRRLFEQVMECSQPKVVDADALNLLAQQPVQRDDWVLTPHPGEAARMLQRSVEQVQQDRFDTVRRLQQRYGGTVVLKGAGSVISDGGRRPPAVCSEGNPGMASGGMGDVLSGVIAGFLAQGHDPVLATELAVCVHGAAATKAARAGERGLLATDLMTHIRCLVNPEND